MLEKIKQFEKKFDELSKEMGKPEVVSNHDLYSKLAKEYSDIEPIVKKGKKYKQILEQIDDTKNILGDETDEEMQELAKEELASLEEQFEYLEKEIQFLITPP